MKRGAEKQISKDDADDDDVEEVPPPEGFRKADESVLATRKIKALPKRSLAGSAATSPSPSAPPTPEPFSTPKFPGFSGFGGAASNSAPFTFTASPILSDSPKPQAVPTTTAFSSYSSAFGTTASTSFPTAAASASPATKASGFMSGSSSAPPSQPTLPSSPSSDAEDEEFRAEVKLLVNFRGLNISFLSAVSKAIEDDPFTDVADLAELYKSYRVSVQTEYDAKVKEIHGLDTVAGASAGPSSAEATFASKPSSVTPPVTSLSQKEPTSMPTPPESFAGFKPLSDSASSWNTTSAKREGAGTTPPTALSFASPTHSPDAQSSSGPAPPKSAFVFGSSGSSPSFSATPEQPTFTFNPAPSSPSKGDTSSSSISAFFGATSSPSAFSSNLFAKRADEKDREVGTGSLFGGPSVFGTPEKSAPGSSNSALTFGSGSPSRPSVFNGLSKSSGSIGNPVGFGFGSPPRSPDLEASASTSTSTSTAKLPGFFLAPPQTAETSRSSSLEAQPSTGSIGSMEGTPAPDTEGEGAEPAQILMSSSSSVHDLEGEGEENEEATHEVRSKVFKMVKDKDGKDKWSDMGVGILRLKRNKLTGARRMLLRNTSTGKVTINFKLYSGMNASAKRNMVSFIGHDEGTATPFRVRTKTEDQASALKLALDREIEFVRAKSDTP
ncbi:predicted protein [Sparassis crispa]|uniref:RanBD1 domain-containing protein n=1 Tax=Sparassis crispa TaxID=139825 RepID=A0A401GGD2_9APHY|nr:predicted protein [Sparassis crispa]GBE81163.1 predicted protein [Sparassis crispa]